MRLVYKRTVMGFLVVLLALGGLLSTPQPARAATITVTTNADEYNTGTGCSLREAITAANTDKAFGGCPAGSGADVIYLPALQGTFYQVSRANTAGTDNSNVNGDLDITSSITFVGGGGIDPAVGTAKSTVRSYNEPNKPVYNDRIFHIIQPAGAPQITVSFNSIGIRGGLPPGVGAAGGGVFNERAIVNLYRVLVWGNNASSGAGLSNSRAGVMTVKESTIIENNGNVGGGIYSEGKLTVENSLIRTNSATDSGGGVDARGLGAEKIVIRNTTITGNQSTQGAGIANGGPLELYHTTIIRNTGVGIDMGQGSQLWMANTILADNILPNENEYAECMIQAEATATVVSRGGNMVEADPLIGGGITLAAVATSCTFDSIDPLSPDLLGLEDNSQFNIGVIKYGKYTGAFQLELNGNLSPAVDFIAAGNEYCPIVDQFFHPRPWNMGSNGCDIGAYEQGSEFAQSIYMPIIRR